MQKEHELTQAVYAAKTDSGRADDLIRSYIPFIRSEAAKCVSHSVDDSDDAYSIAMIAFHEAIMGYERSRGGFLSYASLLIRSRLIDYARKEAKHRGNVSLYADGTEDGEAGASLADTLADPDDAFETSARLEAAKEEIAELSAVLQRFGVTFSDAADNAPRQERTLRACSAAVQAARADASLLDTLLETGKLPMARLVEMSGAERKTLERHRRYLTVMLLILTNGYEIIRGHIYHVLKRGEVEAK